VTTEELKKAVDAATEAVASVKDPALRKAALEKVLEKLLGTHGQRVPEAKVNVKRSSRRAASPVPPRKPQSGPQANVEELIDADFFKKPKQFKAVMEELEARGHHLPRTTLSPTLLALCRGKKLRRRKVDGAWEYSNW
jgi:hypothetical protein